MTGIDSAYHAGGVFDPQEERGDEVLVAELLAKSLICRDGLLADSAAPPAGVASGGHSERAEESRA